MDTVRLLLLPRTPSGYGRYLDTTQLLLLPWTPTIDAIVEVHTNVEINIETEVGFGSVI
jgi:hypothetical protein